MSTASPSSPSSQSRDWVWQVTLMSVVLGVLLALSLRTQHFIAAKGLPPRYSALAGRYFELEQTNRDSEKEIHGLRENITKLEAALKASAQNDTGRPQVVALFKQLQEAKQFAGLTPVEGPGVEVILSDAANGKEMAKQLAGGSDQGADFQNQLSNFLVHDQDIVGVVNELKQAGAEAISVNGQRIIATSSIRCVGPICYINRQPTGGAAPYTILAVGSPRDMENGLRLPGGYLDTQQLLAYKMVSIKHRPKVEIPPYDGLTVFRFAKPTPQKTAKSAPASPTAERTPLGLVPPTEPPPSEARAATKDVTTRGASRSEAPPNSWERTRPAEPPPPALQGTGAPQHPPPLVPAPEPGGSHSADPRE